MHNPTPKSMIIGATKYFDAAETLWPLNTDLVHQSSKPSIFVVYYLIGHSIELSLKSFLLRRGLKKEELKNKYGHDLSALLSESRRRKLGNIVKLTQGEIKAIQLLKVSYNGKMLEYTETGFYRFPPYILIHGIAYKLHSKTSRFCGLRRPFKSKFKT